MDSCRYSSKSSQDFFPGILLPMNRGWIFPYISFQKFLQKIHQQKRFKTNFFWENFEKLTVESLEFLTMKPRGKLQVKTLVEFLEVTPICSTLGTNLKKMWESYQMHICKNFSSIFQSICQEFFQVSLIVTPEFPLVILSRSFSFYTKVSPEVPRFHQIPLEMHPTFPLRIPPGVLVSISADVPL